MPILRIFRPTLLRTQQPLLFEFQGFNKEVSKYGVIQGEYAELELPEGTSGRVVLFVPDGSQLVSSIRMDADNEVIQRFASTSPGSTRLGKSRDFSFSANAASLRDSRQVCAANNGALSFSVMESAARQVVFPSSGSQKVACRLWFYDWSLSKAWQPVAQSELARYGIVDSNQDLSLELPTDVPFLLQCGHPLFGIQNTVLPPGKIIIHMLFVDAPGDREDRIVFDIDLSDSIAESIVTFLQNGETDRAKFMASTVMDFETAQKADPVAAIVGCYFLLKTHQLEKLEQWLNSLSEASKRLPDFWITRGWLLIQSPSKQLELIEKAFVTAASYGLPVFTDGLRMLAEGARLLGESPSMQSLSEKLGRYYGVVSGEQPYTTFPGINPNEPESQSNAKQLDELQTDETTFWLKAQ